MQDQRCDRNAIEDQGQRRNLRDGNAGEEKGAAPEKAEQQKLPPIARRHRPRQDCRTQRFSYRIRSRPTASCIVLWQECRLFLLKFLPYMEGLFMFWRAERIFAEKLSQSDQGRRSACRVGGFAIRRVGIIARM